MSASEVVQYVVAPYIRPHLDAYLASIGWVAVKMPEEGLDSDDLETFVIVPTEATMERIMRRRS